MILLEDFVFLLEGYMADGIVLLNEFLYLLLKIVAGLLGYGLEPLDHLTLFVEVGMLFIALTCSGCITGLKELVAGTEELRPQLIAQFLGYDTDGLPFFLQGNELVACRLPVCRVLQGLGFLNEGTLLLCIVFECIFQSLKIFSLTTEEVITGSTEALEDLHIHLLRSKADGLPFCLDINDFLGMLFPVTTAFVLLGSNSLHLLTKGGLTSQVVFFLGADTLEVLLMTLVDDGGCCLETVPYLFAELLGYRTNLTVFLVKLLQLVESADDIFLFGEVLGSLAQAFFLFLIFLEVIFASLTVQAEHVVELLYVELVVTPQLVGLLCWYILDLTPLLLQGLEVLIVLVSILGGGNHRLDLVDDSQLFHQVLLFLCLLFFEDLGAALLNDAHFGLELFLVFVGGDYILFGVAASIEVGFQLSLTLCNVQLVEGSLQIVDLFFLGCLFAMGDILHTTQHFGLGLIDLTGLSFFFVYNFRSFYFLAYFLFYLLLEGLVLRVHHLTI